MQNNDDKSALDDKPRANNLTFRQRFHSWATTRDPAEDMVPLVTIGVFAVVGGAITIALSVESSQLFVYVGTAATILGAGILTMALVLATLRRGSIRKKARLDDQQSSLSSQSDDSSSPDQ